MRRWLKRLAVLLGALLVLVLVALGGAWVWLHGEGGEAVLRAQVLEATEGALAGRVELTRVALEGTKVVLEGVALYTPEGELVASIDRVELDANLGELLSGVVEVREAVLTRPKLLLVSDERGLNLSRAIASKSVAASAPTAEPATRQRIHVASLRLTSGVLQWRDESRDVVIEDLEATSSATVVTSPLTVDATLTSSGAMTSPLSAPVQLSVTSEGALNVGANLTLGATQLTAHGSVPNQTLQVTEGSTLAPETLRAFVKGWPLAVPVRVTAQLAETNGRVSLAAGSAKVDATATWAADFSAVPTFSLSARDVNLAELTAGGKPSRLTLVLEGGLTDTRSTSLSGAVTLDAEWQRRGGGRVARASAVVGAKSGALEVRALEVLVPGLLVSVHGSASTSQVNLSGLVKASDLSRLEATVHELTGASLPALSGHGALAIEVSGPVSHPAVSLTGALSDVRAATVTAGTFGVALRVPDVRRPLSASGVISGTRVSFGDTTLDALHGSLETNGREVDLELSTKGLGDAVLHIGGLVDADSAGLAVERLSLTAKDVAWALDAPGTVRWARGVEVRGLSLRSGRQRVALDGSKVGSVVHARVAVEAFELEKLPSALMPPSVQVAGALWGTVSVDGVLPRPEVVADLQLKAGAVGGVTDLDASVRATWKKKQAAGSFSVSSSVGRGKGDFDLDADALLADQPVPLRAAISLSDLDAAALLKLARVEGAPARGRFDVRLDLSGTTRSPSTTLTVSSRALEVKAGKQLVSLEDSSVTISTAPDLTLGAEVTTHALGATAMVKVQTPLTLAGLRASPPDVKTLRAMQVTGEVSLTGVDLSRLAPAGFTDDDELVGRLALGATLHGSADAPRFEATASVSHLRRYPFDDVSGELALRGTGEGTTAHGMVKLNGKEALQLDATIAAAPEQLLAVDSLGSERVTVSAVVLPIDLQSLVKSDDPDRALNGRAMVNVTVEGTLAAPKVRATASVRQLAFTKLGLGSARLEWSNDGATQNVRLALGSQSEEDLVVRGTVGLDLSLASLRKGVEVSALPVDLTMTSKELDLAFLSGVTPSLRVLAGKLRLNGSVKGPLGAPSFEGDASWSKGRVVMVGLGDYRDIEVVARATNDERTISKAVVHAGSGSATFTLHAKREPAGHFSFVSEGSTDHFPIINDDQLLAVTSLRYALTGDWLAQTTELLVSLPRVEVELPDVRRKNLQDLERPPDVIVVRAGSKLSNRLRKTAKELAAEKAAEPQGRAWRATLDAPGNVWVRSSDVKAELGFAKDFLVVYSNGTQLSGEVKVLQGKLSVIGREFEVQKGAEIRFAGPVTEPYVNLKAVYTNERDADKTRVTVSVTGRGKQVVDGIKVSAEPPGMSESEIYAMLATGRRKQERGAGVSITPEQAVSAVGSYAASQIKDVLAKKVPIDVLNFEPTDNFASVKLDVGKYLTDSLFLGYSFNSAAKPEKGENSHTVKVRYQLSQSLGLEANAGPAPAAFGAEFAWTHDY